MQGYTNKEKDAEFCGRVPLNQTNMIQPHGILLVIDRESFKVLQVSENAALLTGIPFTDLPGLPLEQLIGQELVKRIREQVTSQIEGKIPYQFRFIPGPSGLPFTGLLQVRDDYMLMEVEKPETKENISFLDQFQELKYLMTAIESAVSVQEACAIAAHELKKVSGFDKVMIYRFDESWNGEVIAEVKEEAIESYLGLKFPSTDIPRQARDLYKRSPYRLIPNINYEGVRLYPVLNPKSGAFTDLSDTNLRSVAPVHLEYLKNMKVEASMSTRIIKEDQLWGLIACHHRTPNYLSYELCAVFELVSNVISFKIQSASNQDLLQFRIERQRTQSALMEAVYRQNDLVGGLLENGDDLLSVLTADGVAIVMDRQINCYGKVPDQSALEDLVYWLQADKGNRLLHHSSLSEVYDPAEAYVTIACGLLALPVQPEKGNFILAFRSEALQKVNWGGNPNEAIRFEADGKNYHPRNSFKLWQETVSKRSMPWMPEEISAAERLRNFVVEYVLNHEAAGK
jgi:light-regulated signal transduction histidine kinase (bacteriophytochrome)